MHVYTVDNQSSEIITVHIHSICHSQEYFIKTLPQFTYSFNRGQGFHQHVMFVLWCVCVSLISRWWSICQQC